MRRLPLVLALAASAVAAQGPERTPLPPGVEVVARAEWGGADPAFALVPHVPRALTVHHTGAPMRPDRDPAATLRALYAFSVSADTLGNGSPKTPWADVPYHFYVAPDGAILEGRDVAFVGDTNTRYDLSGQVQVVVEGSFDREAPTAAQVASLLALSSALAERWGFGPAAVGGHGDRAPGQTVCPGGALSARLPEVRAAVRAGALRSLDGTWTVAADGGPPRPLVVAVGEGGALSGTFGGTPIRDGRAVADGDALRFAFTSGGGAAQTHGRVVGGALEGTTYDAGGRLTTWTATRADAPPRP